VLIVSDVRLYREYLAGVLTGTWHAIPEMSHGGLEARERLTSAVYDVVLLDLRCRDSHDMLKAVATLSPSSKLVAFAVDDDDREILACAEAGVCAYVPSDGSVEDLAHAIESALRGDQYVPQRVAASLFRRLAAPDGPARSPGTAVLTTRERQVLSLLDQGLTNKEISAQLHIEVATVKNHVHNLLMKLRVKTRAQAVLRAG
jgi:DNA-binding NarL/FixJ family response regulator